MKKSTKEFIAEAKQIENFTLFQLFHGWLYMRFPYFYISVGKGDHPLGKALHKILPFFALLFPKRKGNEDAEELDAWANLYHGKVVTLDSANQLVSIKKDISIENLEQIIPFEHAKNIILKNPDHIAVIDCPCRKGKESYCEPLDVCLIVGEPFVSFVLEHHPESSRQISAEEARRIMREENDRGHVQHAYFKDAVLNRFYAICNCCDCCCGAMQANRNGTPMIISSGYVAKVDPSLCTACGTCQELCQFNAITISKTSWINPQVCMGCGVCMNHCPKEAISLSRDLSKPEPLEINQLL